MTQPEKRFKVGSCIASVFVNQVTLGKELRAFPTVSLQRTYMDKAGQFRYSTSLRTNDIPQAIMALVTAYNHLLSSIPAAEVVPERSDENRPQVS